MKTKQQIIKEKFGYGTGYINDNCKQLMECMEVYANQKSNKSVKRYLFVENGMFPRIKHLRSLSQLTKGDKFQLKETTAALFRANENLEIVRVGINGKQK